MDFFVECHKAYGDLVLHYLKQYKTPADVDAGAVRFVNTFLDFVWAVLQIEHRVETHLFSPTIRLISSSRSIRVNVN